MEEEKENHKELGQMDQQRGTKNKARTPYQNVKLVMIMPTLVMITMR